MKSYLFIFLAFVLLGLISCEKVIDLDLNSADPKYVIEGIVTKDQTVHTVKITRTLNFDETAPFPTVDDAVVVISDNLGNAQTLTLASPGTYVTSGYLGVEGRTYTITVTVGGKVFTAQSTMPAQVPLDYLDILTVPFGPDTVKMIVPKRQDPAGIANYYQYDVYRNHIRKDGIYLQDDQFSDGQMNEEPLFTGDLEQGDTATVTMYCIDKPVYKYFYTLSVNTSGSTASPANPESNFGKECLGYFTARTQEQKEVIVP